MAKKKATRIVCNADALSRAADTLLARGSTLSKNAILNVLAGAIAGPGHDWGFLRNAPAGTFVQPGLDRPESDGSDRASTAGPAARTKVWILAFDDQAFWAPQQARAFATQEDAIAALLAEPNSWRHPDHPDDVVIDILRRTGEYTFAAPEEGDEDGEPYRISLYQTAIEGGLAADPSHPTQPFFRSPRNRWTSKLGLPAETLGRSISRLHGEGKIIVLRQAVPDKGPLDFVRTLAFSDGANTFPHGAMGPTILDVKLETLAGKTGEAVAAGNLLLSPGLVLLTGLDRCDGAIESRLAEELEQWADTDHGPAEKACVIVLVPTEDRDYLTFFASLGHIPGLRECAVFAEIEEAGGMADAKSPDIQAGKPLAVRFEPQAWINDHAVSVDPEGETRWLVDPDEIDPDESDNDYLISSRRAPHWVRDWSGPFEIHIESANGNDSAD